MQPSSFFNAAFLSQVLIFSSAFATGQEFSGNINLDKRRPASQFDKRSPITGQIITPAILRPVDAFHPVLGRRDLNTLDEAHLKPATDLMLEWATKTEDGVFLRAQMDITSDDGTKLLFMSRFQGFTKSVDCSIKDGDGLSIVFSKPEYLELAKKQWGWLTEDAGNTFWMITNHKDCSKDADPLDEYVPYLITDVDYTDSVTAEFVKAERKTLEEALSEFNFDFNWGHVTADQQPLVKRGITDWVEGAVSWFEEGFQSLKDKLGDTADAIKDKFDDAGKLDFGDQWEIEINQGESGVRSRLGESFLPSDKELYCVDCYMQGKFNVGGRVRSEKFVDVKEASFSLSPQDVKLMMKLNAKFSTSEWSTTVIPLFGFPLTPIEIPGLFHFGPEISVDFEFGYQINEPLDFEFGVEASLPNDAKVANDLMDEQNLIFENWDKASAGALPFDLKSGAVDLDLSAGPVLALSFGYSIFGIGGHEAALRASLPRWGGNYTSFMDEAGACEQNEEANKIGINIDQSLTADVRFFVGGTGMMSSEEGPVVNKVLWENTWDIAHSCKGIQSYADDPEYKALDQELDELDAEELALEEELALLEEEIALNKEYAGFTEGGLYANMTSEDGADLGVDDGSALPSGTANTPSPTGYVAGPTGTATGGWNATYPGTNYTVPPLAGLTVEALENDRLARVAAEAAAMDSEAQL